MAEAAEAAREDSHRQGKAEVVQGRRPVRTQRQGHADPEATSSQRHVGAADEEGCEDHGEPSRHEGRLPPLQLRQVCLYDG